MRAGIYSRLSLLQKGEVDLSTVRQAEDAQVIAEREGAEVVRAWRDSGRSAWTGADREDFDQMITAIKQREIDVLIAWKFDRLTRNLDDYADLHNAIKASRAHLITGDGVDTRNGWMVADMLFAMARQESENISIRVRRKHDEIAASGAPTRGGFGYKYLRDDAGKRLEIIPREAAMVREAVTRILNGDGISNICRDWNEQGIPAPTGKPWRRTTLRGILLAPRIAGLRMHRGEIVGEGTWEPILERPQWERIVALLSDPKRRITPSQPRTYPLSGLLFCGRCDHRLYAKMYHSVGGPNARSKYRYSSRAYQCLGREGGCDRLGIQADATEAYVRELTVGRLSMPKVRNGLLAAQVETEVSYDGLVDEIEANRLAVERLSEDYYVKRLMPRSIFESTMTQLNDAIEAAERALRMTTGSAAILDMPRARAELEQKWDEGDVAQKRTMVATVMERVVINPAPNRGSKTVDLSRIAPVWRLPSE